jgi:hypothetical protein
MPPDVMMRHADGLVAVPVLIEHHDRYL